MKKFAVNKIKVDSTIRALTKRMYEINLFVSIQTKPHKESDKEKEIARCVFWQIGKRIWSLQKDHSGCH